MSESNTSIVKHFDNYVEKLVDLTARNRLLRYPERSARIRFVQDIDILREHGYDHRDFSICWSEADIRKIGDEEINNGSLFTAEPAVDDNWLLRNSEPQGEKLIKQLTNFKRDQRRIIEEHGVHSLYLAVGTLSWTEEINTKNGDKTKKFYAPILLVPIEVTRETRGSIQWHIMPTEGQEAEINLALRLYLKRRQNGIDVDFSDVEQIDIKEAANRFIEAFREVGLVVEYKHEAFIGQFVFSGQHIHEDLKNNQVQFLNQDIVRAVCGEITALGEEENTQINTSDDPDELLKPSEDYSVLNADPSQLRVVTMGVNDRSFVVQGPPGTGKSQTIVNLLTNLAARGKSVLFVCEKRVAMEVVYRRMNECSLGAICLPIFELNRGAKVNIARTVCDDAAQVSSFIKGTAKLENLLTQREDIRTLLSGYASLLKSPISPLGRSLHWIYNEMSRSDGRDRVLIKWNLDKYNPFEKNAEEYSRAMHLFYNAEFGRYQDAYKKKERFNWVQTTLQEALVETSLEKFESLRDAVAAFISHSTLVASNGLSSVVKALEIGGNGQLDQTLSIFKQDKYLSDVHITLKSCERLIGEYQKVIAEYPDALKLSESGWKGDAPSEIIDINQFQIGDVLHFVDRGDSSARILKRSLKTFFLSPLLLESRDEIQRLYKLSKLDTDLLNSLPATVNYVSVKIALSHLEKVSAAQIQQNTIQEIVATTWGVDLIRSAIQIAGLKDDISLALKGSFKLFAFVLPRYRRAASSLRTLCLMGSTNPKSMSVLAKHINTFQQIEKERLGLEHQISDLLGYPSFNKSDVLRVIDAVQKWHEITGLETLDSVVMKKVLEIKHDPEISFVIEVIGDQLAWLDDLVAKYPALQLPTMDTRGILERALQLFDYLKSTSVHLLGLDRVKDFPSHKTVSALICDIGHRDVLNELAAKLTALTESCSEDFRNIHDASCVERVLKAQQETSSVVQKLNDSGIDYTGAPILEVDKLLAILNQPVFKKTAHELFETLDGFVAEYDAAGLHRVSLAQAKNWLDELIGDPEGFVNWQAYKVFLGRLDKIQLGWLAEKVIELESSTIISSLVYSYWWTWLASAKEAGFEILTPEELGEASLKFKELDKQVLSLNHVRILSSVCRSERYEVPSRMLRHEAGKKRQIKPLRSLISDTPTASYLQGAKPIWMMSPSAVSASLGASSIKFDYVVFDESSQLRVEHSLPALARAKRVVAFGDEHQLPPTNFFFASDIQEETEEEMVVFEDVLSSLNTIFSGKSRATLNFHYRSRFEELIAFSNSFVYENRLITSPNPTKSSDAVKFVYVPDGFFSNQVNLVEAQEVAKVCVTQITEHPNESLGVIAFSRKQEVAIRDAVLELIRGNADAEILLDEERDCEEPFFIKNLENVQGDERDRIILSVGYGPDKVGGKVAQRFGPLNSKDGYRRLNVAVTRSKVQMICVSSMKAENVKIDEDDASRGRIMLRKFLEYSERGISALEAQVNRSQECETENEFEQTIMNALVARGLEVHPQVGVSSYRIDLGVLDPKDKTRYVLGVECDGATYHSSYSARLNDRLRQEHLENLGWNIYRIWSSDWVERPNEIADEIAAMVRGAASR